METYRVAGEIEGEHPIVFLSPIVVPNSSGHQSPVRLMEFALHTNDGAIHVPSGGTVGQVLKMTANGPAWVDE